MVNEVIHLKHLKTVSDIESAFHKYLLMLFHFVMMSALLLDDAWTCSSRTRHSSSSRTCHFGKWHFPPLTDSNQKLTAFLESPGAALNHYQVSQTWTLKCCLSPPLLSGAYHSHTLSLTWVTEKVFRLVSQSPPFMPFFPLILPHKATTVIF